MSNYQAEPSEHAAEHRVVAAYPKAWVHGFDEGYRIQPHSDYKRGGDAIGRGWTESEAWADAASRLSGAGGVQAGDLPACRKRVA